MNEAKHCIWNITRTWNASADLCVADAMFVSAKYSFGLTGTQEGASFNIGMNAHLNKISGVAIIVNATSIESSACSFPSKPRY